MISHDFQVISHGKLATFSRGPQEDLLRLQPGGHRLWQRAEGVLVGAATR